MSFVYLITHVSNADSDSESTIVTESSPNNFRLTFFRLRLLILGIFAFYNVGCATVPYRYGNFHTAKQEQPAEVEFEYGKPHKVLDGIAWTTGIWSRMLTMNRNVNNHDLSDESREKLINYMVENDLDDVLVRVNQYDPKGEWRRLRENHRVSAGWRYTFGLIAMAHYTFLPGRVFGGDEYNPFTNSLYINSDVPAIALHEAAYAKDIHSRALPGTYAFVNELPLIGLWRHTLGVNDVLGYAQISDDWPVERETYRVVYPRMGIYSVAISGSAIRFWDGIILTAAGAAAGHVTGQVALSQRERERKLEDSPSDSVPEGTSEAESEEISSTTPEKGTSTDSIRFVKHESARRRDE